MMSLKWCWLVGWWSTSYLLAFVLAPFSLSRYYFWLKCMYINLLRWHKMVGIVVTVLMPMHKIYVSMVSTGGENTTLKYYFTFGYETSSLFTRALRSPLNFLFRLSLPGRNALNLFNCARVQIKLWGKKAQTFFSSLKSLLPLWSI